jgi:hypothetical protein
MSNWTPKIGRHVTYYGTNRKPRPGTITGVTSNTVVDVRVTHSGETHAAVSKETSTPYSAQTGVWSQLGR